MSIFDRFRPSQTSPTGQVVSTGANDSSIDREQEATRLIEEGHTLEANGKLDEAMQRYLDAIRIAPNPARAHLNFGNVKLLKGDLQGALDAYKAALQHKHDYAGAYFNMGNALLNNGRSNEAIENYQKALEIQPDYAEVLCSLGVAQKNIGKLDDAISSFQKALNSNPHLAEAQVNLGNVLDELFNKALKLLNDGELEDAIVYLRQVIKIEPNLAEAHFNMGDALKRLNKNEDAVTCYRRTLAIKPDHAKALASMGVALHDLWKFDEELDCYRRAIEINPDLAEAHSNLGVTLKEQGELAEAEASYRRAIQLQPGNAMFRVAHSFTIPIAPQTEREASTVTKEFDRSLNELSDWLKSSPQNFSAYSEAIGSQQPFYLAYRYGNHVSLLSRYGDLVATRSDQDAITPLPERNRIRLVVVSNHFRRHSVWDVVLRGIIENIDRSRFEVILYNMGLIEDEETVFAKSRCDVWRDLHAVPDFDGWLKVMSIDQPDVIFYPEIGMDPLTCRLATRRLAPLQIAGWGHPITTGLPTIDLFFSGEMIEGPDAETHYRERLVRLPGTGCCTTPIKAKPEPVPEIEAELLKRRGIRFVIAQTPFKFDPTDDHLFADIANAVGECTFIILNDPQFSWATDRLMDRLNNAFRERSIDPEQHLVTIPWLSREKFYSLLDLCDVYLDCPSFSGYTTAWQAIHRGMPIVTLEGEYMRQRLASGLLRRIGMTDTIASSKHEFVAIATRMAAECIDSDRRTKLRDKLKMAARIADHDVDVVRAFEQEIEGALTDIGRKSESPSQEKLNPASSIHEGPEMKQEMKVDKKSDHEPVWKMLEDDLHIHTLDPNYAPTGLLEMVTPAPKRVLDLGCFCGGTGRWLKNRFPDCEVIGIEMLDKAAAIAAQAYDRVIAGAFENVDFAAEGLTAGSFDAIIAADVLEHIYNPWKALQRLKPLLAPGGAIYVSLPNIRNLNVLSGLASGKWSYQGAGILDITHIRFFTLAQAGEMLSQTGWVIGDSRVNPDPSLAPLYEGKDLSEIRSINMGNLKLEGLNQMDVAELIAIQFFIRATAGIQNH